MWNAPVAKDTFGNNAPLMNPLPSLLRRPLLHVAALSAAVNLLLLAPALFMLQVFDRVLSSRSGETLLALLLGAAVALALMLVLDHLRGRLQQVAGQLAAESLMPVVARLTVAQGAMGAANGNGLRDVAVLRTLLSSQALLALFDAPWIVAYVLVIGLAHPVLGLAAAAAALTMLAVAWVTDRAARRNLAPMAEAATQAQRTLDASLANAEVAQVLGMTPALVAIWREKNTQLTALQAPGARRSVAMAATARALRQLIQIGMLGLGAWLVIDGQASAGVMIATTTLLGRALAPVEQAVASWRVLAEGRAAWQRLGALLEATQTAAPAMDLPPPKGELLAQALSWRAPGSERVVLANVSLQLEAGQALAVIGASAAGKSTLLRLLTGVLPPAAGTVRLDGADLSQWPRERIGPHIGYVPQDVELFPGTVAGNIARMGPVDAQAVVRAAERAHVHEMILTLPQGYDTPVNTQGALLSPGQRQRIALARALYGEPKLVLLDEPNSNLDGAGEQALGEALAGLRGKVTVVVVTHRNTLIQHMDKLMVLNGGRVQHYGPAAQVLKAMQGAPATSTAKPALEHVA
jgi:PrtD family type I secretion system ABC transporter